MKRPVKKTLTWLTLAVFLASQAGCVPMPSRRSSPPPSEEVRAGLGRVAIVSGQYRPVAELMGYSRGKGGGALKGAAIGGFGAFGSAVIVLAPLAPLGPVVLLIPLALAVPGALTGAMAGAGYSETGKKVREYEESLGKAIEALTPHDSLRSITYELARENTALSVLEVTDLGPMEPVVEPSPAFEEEDFESGTVLVRKPEPENKAPDYTALKARGIDTVLEIVVERYGLLGGALGINSPLSAFMVAKVRLVSTLDNTVLREDSIWYAGSLRKLSDWAENGAEMFTLEMRSVYRALAQKAVDDIFLTIRVPWLRDNYPSKRTTRGGPEPGETEEW